MSVILKGVQMPETCKGCFVDGSTCQLWRGFDRWKTERHPECPLSPASGIERLSGEYNRGYTKAIQDVTDILEYVGADLRGHRKGLTLKLALQLMGIILENRERIRENRDGVIRWNVGQNGFEWYITKKK